MRWYTSWVVVVLLCAGALSCRSGGAGESGAAGAPAPELAQTGPAGPTAPADTRSAGSHAADEGAVAGPGRSPTALDAHRFGGALRLARGYLVRAVRPDGKFTYEYDPATDLDSGSYNILRHAGTVYAMMELYGVERDPQLLAAAERAIGYLLAQVKPGPVEETACVVDSGSVKLGGNALAAVALAEHARVTGDRRHVPVVLQLNRWMLLNQEASGRFVGHKQRYPGRQRSKFESQYYPGEAILALARTHALDPGGPWMAKAHRAADWLITVRDAGKTPATIPHDHWLLYGLNELYADEPRRAYVDHGLLISRAILDDNVAVPTDEESEGRAAAANQIATRIEGLCAAHPLLARAGEEAAADEVRAAVGRAVRALLALQFTAEDAARFPNPQRVAGGFRGSSNADAIRIDTVQHAVSALVAAGELLGPEAAPTAGEADEPQRAQRTQRRAGGRLATDGAQIHTD